MNLEGNSVSENFIESTKNFFDKLINNKRNSSLTIDKNTFVSPKSSKNMNIRDLDEGSVKQRPRDSISRNILKNYFDNHLFSNEIKYSHRKILPCNNLNEPTSGEKNSEILISSNKDQVIDSSSQLMVDSEKLNFSGIIKIIKIL